MSLLNGKKEILVGTEPVGFTPDPGYIYKWVEAISGGFAYKYKDENDVPISYCV